MSCRRQGKEAAATLIQCLIRGFLVRNCVVHRSRSVFEELASAIHQDLEESSHLSPNKNDSLFDLPLFERLSICRPFFTNRESPTVSSGNVELQSTAELTHELRLVREMLAAHPLTRSSAVYISDEEDAGRDK